MSQQVVKTCTHCGKGKFICTSTDCSAYKKSSCSRTCRICDPDYEGMCHFKMVTERKGNPQFIGGCAVIQ
jgi:hypothetical protein